jgi:2-isopropylmalate synthase
VKKRIEIYDTTLRDGAQGPGVKFSPDDQLRVVHALDEMGVAYIEGGQPGSNPKAQELFRRANDLSLKHAKMAAFGSTRHPKSAVEDDANVRALLAADTEIVTIFAKTSPLHVREVLGVTLEENLALIQETVHYLKAAGRRVFVDAEHFFDGYREDAEYALAVCGAADTAGAETVILCDTNGGGLPAAIGAVTRTVREELPRLKIGIHTHNDTGCAVANTLAAVAEGAVQIQGTINGYGERTGNMNLITCIPNLQLKMGYTLISDEEMAKLTHVSHLAAELANMTPRDHDPYVGRDAFTHKGGMHADAVRKNKASYEHLDPVRVGNRTHIAVSELSGRSSLIQKAREFNIELDRDGEETQRILQRIKELENEGYEFEGADASLELIMRRATGRYPRFFESISFHSRVNKLPHDKVAVSEAAIKVRLPREDEEAITGGADGPIAHTVAEGHGPVDALNNALRKALQTRFPEINELHLEDYKVRILDGKLATRAKTRVLIESSDTLHSWNTIGVSENIIQASWEALLDSIEYKLLRARGYIPGA